MTSLPWLDDLARDVRCGVRLLFRSRVFTLFAVASLALGIGVTGATFTLFDAIVLQKLAVPDPDRLVVASFGGPGGRLNYSLPYPQFEQIHQRNATLSGLFAMYPFGRVTLSVRGEPGIAEGVQVTGDYYSALELAPSVGRLIQPADDRPGEAVAVLSHAYWQRRFGGHSDIVGTAVTLNGVPFTIIGVEPAGFVGTEVGRTYDVSIPMRARDALNGENALRSDAFATWIYVMGRLKPGVTIEQAETDIRVAFNNLAPGYFATLGIPLVAGRDFEERDSPDAPKVVIVSERLARHFAGNPVGQRIGAGRGAREVIGVVQDTRYANIKDAPREVLYFPFFQAQPKEFLSSPTFEIRYAGGMQDVLSSVREAMSRVDPRLLMFRVRTLEEQTQDSLSRERLLALLTSYLGGFAVVLACIGLYGLTSYAVTLRTAEIGLRMALGAQSANVLWMIVREATVTVVVGNIAGLMVTLGAVRLVRSQLFGVEPHDPMALAGATALLLAMALIAAYLPARRASRIDPLSALRHE